MATLIIDEDKRVEISAQPHESVFDILLRAQEVHWPISKAIAAVQVNGKLIDPPDELTLKGIPGEDAEITVFLENDDQGEEVGLDRVIQNAEDYLSKLAEGFEALANRIRNEDNSDAYKDLGEGMEGLATIVELFEALGDPESVPQKLRLEFKAFLEELSVKSQELMDAQESQDPTLIADILEYEFVEAVQELKDFLSKFADYHE